MSKNESSNGGGRPLQVDESSFEHTVMRDDDVPVIVDYWAPWCGPCHAMSPVLDDIAREYAGRAVVAKVNVDENPELAQTMRIQAIPTLHLLRRGKLVDAMVGLQRKGALAARLDQLISGAVKSAGG